MVDQGSPVPPRRLVPLTQKAVTLVVDGRDVEAREGEPVAHAILASGRWVFGRSVKYHRARGPVCVSGRCEGCLMRVDGVSSVMTCRQKARHGMRCDAQNVVGSAQHDLLAMTDFLFPEGLDHHEMFTWSKPVNRTMQLVAREIAGVGTLPDEHEAPKPVTRADVDVLVVGGGIAGLTVAIACQKAGRKTLLLEEDAAFSPEMGALPETARTLGVDLHLETSALGLFVETDGRRIVLADGVSSSGPAAMSIAPKVLVCAMGSAETGHTFEGNDLPGVIHASAAERLLDQGILVGERVVLAVDPREDGLASRLAARLIEAGAEVERISLSALHRARGRTGVRHVETSGGTFDCDVLVVASLRGPVTELPQQAGAKVGFDGERFVIEASAHDGETAHPATFVVGSAILFGASPEEILAHAERTAHAVIAATEEAEHG